MNPARALAAAITAIPPGELLMGNVVSVDYTAPGSGGLGPTLTIDLRGGPISGVRYLANVAPRPGYAVILQRFGQDLVAVGTLAQHGWPACRVRRNTDTSTFAATQTVTFDTTVTDPWGMWTGGTNVVIPIPGVYDVAATVQFDGDSTGTYRGLSVQDNGSPVAWQRVPPPPSGTTNPVLGASAMAVPMSAGDVITLVAEHTSSTSRLLVGGADHRSALAVVYRGPRT